MLLKKTQETYPTTKRCVFGWVGSFFSPRTSAVKQTTKTISREFSRLARTVTPSVAIKQVEAVASVWFESHGNMDGNDQGDDFDDFFDTPGRQDQDSPQEERRKDKVSPLRSPDSSPGRSASKKHDRNGSGSVDRRSMSSDSHSSPEYSSDSETDSESASRNSRRRKSRSRSASSRSAGSHSSRDSLTERNGRDNRDSKSASSDRSRSRSSSPECHRRGHRSYQKERRRDSSTSLTSSTGSESEKGGRRAPSPRQPHRQAWTTDSGDRAASRRPQDRPKTAKRRSANGEEGRTRHGNRRRHSPVDSDSDITDVSPIASPRNGSVNGHKMGASSSGSRYNGSKPVFQAMPVDEDSAHSDMLAGGDSNALDLNILMKAVSELEKQKRVKANTRHVMFEPTRPRPMEKSNYTFSNDDTHRIEKENKRLLREIMRQVHTNERGPAVRRPDVRVRQSTLTAAAVNRRREQKRIENENLVGIDVM
ncbi:hypothetical protein BaRGS_00026780 [Batillaria attramentaria]|uniref:Cilia- and flagella-associated protein 97 n=1 Tax=Batillaria attramentaria TaxID=370345 RepID=A0ABD0K4J1_9CAEN